MRHKKNPYTYDWKYTFYTVAVLSYQKNHMILPILPRLLIFKRNLFCDFKTLPFLLWAGVGLLLSPSLLDVGFPPAKIIEGGGAVKDSMSPLE